MSFDALCCGQNSHKMLPFDDGGTDLERQQQEQPSEAGPGHGGCAGIGVRPPAGVLGRLARGRLCLAYVEQCANFRQIVLMAEALIFPISISLCILYFFGTLDSSAVGKRAVKCWALWWVYLAVSTRLSPSGRAENLFYGDWYISFTSRSSRPPTDGSMNVLRSELRALGSVDTTRITSQDYTRSWGFKPLMAVIVATQGVGPKAFDDHCDGVFLDG